MERRWTDKQMEIINYAAGEVYEEQTPSLVTESPNAKAEVSILKQKVVRGLAMMAFPLVIMAGAGYLLKDSSIQPVQTETVYAQGETEETLKLFPEYRLLEAPVDAYGRGGFASVTAAVNPNTGGGLLVAEVISPLDPADPDNWMGKVDLGWLIIGPDGQTTGQASALSSLNEELANPNFLRNGLSTDELINEISQRLGTLPDSSGLFRLNLTGREVNLPASLAESSPTYAQRIGPDVVFNPVTGEYLVAATGVTLDRKTMDILTPSKAFFLGSSSSGELKTEQIFFPDFANEGLQYNPSIAVNPTTGKVVAAWTEVFSAVQGDDSASKDKHRLEIFAQVFDGELKPEGPLIRVFNEDYMQSPQVIWVGERPVVVGHLPYMYIDKSGYLRLATDIKVADLETGRIFSLNNLPGEEKYDTSIVSPVVLPDGNWLLAYARGPGLSIFSLPQEVVYQTGTPELEPHSTSKPEVIYEHGLDPVVALLGKETLLVGFGQLVPVKDPYGGYRTFYREEQEITYYDLAQRQTGPVRPFSQKETHQGKLSFLVNQENFTALSNFSTQQGIWARIGRLDRHP